MEKQGADAVHLPPCCKGPQTHLYAGCNQHSETKDRIVDAASASNKVTSGFAASVTVIERLQKKGLFL